MLRFFQRCREFFSCHHRDVPFFCELIDFLGQLFYLNSLALGFDRFDLQLNDHIFDRGVVHPGEPLSRQEFAHSFDLFRLDLAYSFQLRLVFVSQIRIRLIVF